MTEAAPTGALRPVLPVAAAAALIASAAAPLRAQTGEEIMRTLLDRYEQRMGDVRDYTVVQEVMGFESSIFFERTEMEGHALFVPRMETGSEAAQRPRESPYVGMFELAERSLHEGFRNVDGARCHVVGVTDFRGTGLFGAGGATGMEDFEPEKVTFLVDADDYLLRGIELEGTTTARGAPQAVSFRAEFSDYREVKGVVHPFRTSVSVRGMGRRMSPEERAQMKESLRRMRSRMEEMPELQRALMDQMMGGGIEQIRKMMASGAVDFTVRVTEIRVDRGPPEGS